MKNVTCENKRMGALQFDYAGSTLTFPPGRFVTDEVIARSAESRLSPADFQIVHEAPRTAAEPYPDAPPAPLGQGTATSPPEVVTPPEAPDPVVVPPSAPAPQKSTAAPKPPKGRAATARKPKE